VPLAHFRFTPDIGCLRVRALEAAIAMGRTNGDDQSIRSQPWNLLKRVLFFQGQFCFHLGARKAPVMSRGFAKFGLARIFTSHVL